MHSPRKKYGQAFYVSKEWLGNIVERKYITDRLSYIKFKIHQPNDAERFLVVVNVYAPTGSITKSDPRETELFYESLNNLIGRFQAVNHIVILGGDFNAKIGKKVNDQEMFIGNYGRGDRNINGEFMADLLVQNNLCVANTLFKHKCVRISTHHSQNRQNIFHSQIDYLVVPQLYKNNIKNARVYNGTKYVSDHNMVIMKFKMNGLFHKYNYNKIVIKKYDTNLLVVDENKYQQYKNVINQKIIQNRNNQFVDLNARLMSIDEIIMNSVVKVLPKRDPAINAIIKFDDLVINKLVDERKEVIDKIRRVNVAINDLDIRANKTQRNWYAWRIKKRLKELHNKRIDDLCTLLDDNNLNSKCYQVQRLLRFRKYCKFKLVDNNNDEIVDNINGCVKTFFNSFYNQEGFVAIDPFLGNHNPLDVLITPEEVRVACMNLSNGRASGKDELVGEYYKYTGYELYRELAVIYNGIFTENCVVESLLDGVLIPLNKPNKICKVENSRPITLLNTGRKILSKVLLNRIYLQLDRFISLGQSGFRKGRSTADVLWSYRLLMAICQRYNINMNITAIDMSKAFDCINRSKLLEVCSGLISESNLRILRFLLSTTRLISRVDGVYGEYFNTLIGVPQGDSLSPVLFTTYLSAAILQYTNENQLIMGPLQHIISYADDTDLININPNMNDLVQIFSQWNLKINPDKTEIININKADRRNINVKKLGNKISGNLDIVHRMSLARLAFNELHRIWNHSKQICVRIKLRLFNSCVISILMYNLNCVATLKSELEKIDAFHRKLLKRLLNIYYPRMISNMNLYNYTNEVPISLLILKRRWLFFGNLLRQNHMAPFNVLLREYINMVNNNNIYHSDRRCSKNSIPEILHHDLLHLSNDIKLIIIEECELDDQFVFDLVKIEHYNGLRNLAMNKTNWKLFVRKIVEERTFSYFQIVREKYNRGRVRRMNQLLEGYVVEDVPIVNNNDNNNIEVVNNIVNNIFFEDEIENNYNNVIVVQNIDEVIVGIEDM